MSEELRRLVEEMRTIAMVAGQCSVEGKIGTKSAMAAAEASRCARWANELEALASSLSGTPAAPAETPHEKVKAHLIRLAKLVTRPTTYGFQTLRRDREDDSIEYQIFADTEPNGCQIAWVQSTRHDADFIAACLAQAPIFAELLGVPAASLQAKPSAERFESDENHWCVYCNIPWEVRIVAPPGGCLVPACRTCGRTYRLACSTNRPSEPPAPRAPPESRGTEDERNRMAR